MENKIPEIDLKIETIEVKGGIRKRRKVLHKGKLRYKQRLPRKQKKIYKKEQEKGFDIYYHPYVHNYLEEYLEFMDYNEKLIYSTLKIPKELLDSEEITPITRK